MWGGGGGRGGGGGGTGCVRACGGVTDWWGGWGEVYFHDTPFANDVFSIVHSRKVPTVQKICDGYIFYF